MNASQPTAALVVSLTGFCTSMGRASERSCCSLMRRAADTLGNMRRDTHGMHPIPSFIQMSAALLLLHGLAPSFALYKQAPLSRNRDRVGLGFHTKASNHSKPLSVEGRTLLSKITAAGQKGDWVDVKRMFALYSGMECQVLHSVMHAAYTCGQYREAARVYTRMCDLKVAKDAPVYATALKVFSKLEQPTAVRDIWTEALKVCELDKLLAAARIVAAAVEGDIQTAAEVLDLMNKTGVEINQGHITSAIRACWEATGSTHNAAEYLYRLHIDLDLQADIAMFTCLVGAYKTAPLEKIMGAYSDMQAMHIKSDFAFAETYLATLLLKPKEQRFNQQEMLAWLCQLPGPRIAAAKSALDNFRQEGIELTSLSRQFAQALSRL